MHFSHTNTHKHAHAHLCVRMCVCMLVVTTLLLSWGSTCLHPYFSTWCGDRKEGRLDFTRTCSKNTIGFLIFAFVSLATPNQHLLTLPSSPVSKSPDLHAEIQQPTQDTSSFFLYTYYPVGTHSPISPDNFST